MSLPIFPLLPASFSSVSSHDIEVTCTEAISQAMWFGVNSSTWHRLMKIQFIDD